MDEAGERVGKNLHQKVGNLREKSTYEMSMGEENLNIAPRSFCKTTAKPTPLTFMMTNLV